MIIFACLRSTLGGVGGLQSAGRIISSSGNSFLFHPYIITDNKDDIKDNKDNIKDNKDDIIDNKDNNTDNKNNITDNKDSIPNKTIK